MTIDPADLARHPQRQRRLAAGSRTRYQHRSSFRPHRLPARRTPSCRFSASSPIRPTRRSSQSSSQAIHHEIGGEINWLNHGVACEIIQPKHADPLGIARGIIDTRPIDAALVPLANRRKRLLVADMDSTMINEECIDELGAAIGIKDRGRRDHRPRHARRARFRRRAAARASACSRASTRKQIEEVRRERITLAPGGRALVQTMKAYGAYTALVSGGFTFFADYFGKRIGFDEVTANTLKFDGDVLDGTVSRPDRRQGRQAQPARPTSSRRATFPRSRPWRSATAPTTST